MQIELDAEARNELAAMAYARWSSAYDAMKHVKNMTWETNKQVCPKGEWHLFHASMTENAQKELDKATRIKDSICKYSPLILGE